MAKISIIIPIYNSEKYMEECLGSIQAQTFLDIEIILVDDGSTDSSLELCQRYAGMDNRISVIHQENKGVASARKVGLKAAKAEYISFVDSDDWIEPRFFETMYGLATRYQADMVISGCMIEQNQNSYAVINRFEEKFYDKKALKDEVYPSMLNFKDNKTFGFGILQYLWNKLYKRSIIEPCIQNLDERIYDGEDVACVFDACLRASSIVIDNHPFYHYRIHADSICTSKRDERYLVNAVYLYRYMEHVFRCTEEYELMMPQLRYFMAHFINNGTKVMFGFNYERAYSYSIWELPQLPIKGKCQVAVFGAGNIGKTYCRQLLQMKSIEITAVVDSHEYGKKVEGIDIEKPEILLNKPWDYILVAVKRKSQALEIVLWLKDHGIPEEKIFYKEPQRKYPLYELQLK